MGKERDLFTTWKRAKHQLDEIFKTPEHVAVIHYSCESFYDRDDPRSPRVTSIAVRNLESGQTRSFSIHQVAERRGKLDGITEYYDELEREMLGDFFQVVRERQHCKWLHWNMRDSNYGFEALENRLRVLGATPAALVPEDKRIDLSRLLIAIYGVRYTGHPRLETLMERNSITPKDFLVGKAEAEAFENRQFLKLHQSTLRKVDILANISERAHSDTLKSAATWWDRNGRSIRAAGEWLQEHWLIGGLVAIVSATAAAIRFWPVFAGIF